MYILSSTYLNVGHEMIVGFLLDHRTIVVRVDTVAWGGYILSIFVVQFLCIIAVLMILSIHILHYVVILFLVCSILLYLTYAQY